MKNYTIHDAREAWQVLGSRRTANYKRCAEWNGKDHCPVPGGKETLSQERGPTWCGSRMLGLAKWPRWWQASGENLESLGCGDKTGNISNHHVSNHERSQVILASSCL